MAPRSFTDDYYATLGVRQTADEGEIKSSYKKLARLRHPDKNINNPRATSEFQLLQAAYSTLIDPGLRRVYDIQYPSIRSRAQATTTHAGNTPPETGSQADETQGYKQKINELEKALRELYAKKKRLDSDLFEARRRLNKSQSALIKLLEEACKDAQEDSARDSWLGYFFSRRLSPEEVEAKERRTTERKMGQIVREAEHERCLASLRQSQAQVDKLDAEIVKVQAKKSRIQQQEWSRQEEARLEEEMLRRAQENERARQEREKARRQQEERYERVRKEEEARRAREEELRKTRAEKQQRAAERPELNRKEKERKTKETQRRRHGAEAVTRCRHQGWWDHESGRHVCGRCLHMTSRFAFRCPGCRTVACAGCRDILKEGA